jgi:hypothetical protein
LVKRGILKMRNKKGRKKDGPVVCNDGGRYWYENGNLHRTDGPAIEYSDGDKHWYINGERHREDGPAVEKPDGTKYWCKNGKLHRIGGPAIEYSDGNKHWYINGVEQIDFVMKSIWLKEGF